MASNYYGLNKGQNQTQVVVGTSTGSTDVELRVDMAKISSREDALVVLENIRNAFIQATFP